MILKLVSVESIEYFAFWLCFTQTACLAGEFDCGEGTCIERDRVCNGVPDCPDGIDEDGCAEYATEPITEEYLPDEYDGTTTATILTTGSFDRRAEVPDYYPEQTTSLYCKSFICCDFSKIRSACSFIAWEFKTFVLAITRCLCLCGHFDLSIQIDSFYYSQKWPFLVHHAPLYVPWIWNFTYMLTHAFAFHLPIQSRIHSKCNQSIINHSRRGASLLTVFMCVVPFSLVLCDAIDCFVFKILNSFMRVFWFVVGLVWSLFY